MTPGKLPFPAPWSPSPVIHASFWLHGLAAAATVLWPCRWRWMLGAVTANHMALGAIGLRPRSTLLGPNLLRLPQGAAGRKQVVLTFDDGPDPVVTPAVLDLLDRYGATASFFCIGRRAASHPALLADTARRGHSVENHTDTHPNAFALLPLPALRREVEWAQIRLGDITGQPPRFFRAPMGLRSPLLDPVLAGLDLRLVTWTRRGYDTVATPNTTLHRLTDGLADGDILVLHDGIAGSGAGNAAVLKVLPRLLDGMAALGLSAVSLPRALGEA